MASTKWVPLHLVVFIRGRATPIRLCELLTKPMSLCGINVREAPEDDPAQNPMIEQKVCNRADDAVTD
jgi:hypothetical protein